MSSCNARWSLIRPGRAARRRRSSGETARSSRGMTQAGVRWKTVTCAASDAISGTSCTDDAPVPITATRLPASDRVWSQRLEWKVSPANDPMPGTSG